MDQTTLLPRSGIYSICFAGMISSAMLWGYLSDTLGRKKILVFGYLLDAVCNVVVSIK